MIRERRSAIRFPVRLPAWVRWNTPSGKAQEVRGTTSDISSNGLLVMLPGHPRLQTEVLCTVCLPATVTATPAELRCHGRVVRCVRRGRLVEMGATIEDYELTPAVARA
jgi:hypothetical protein